MNHVGESNESTLSLFFCGRCVRELLVLNTWISLATDLIFDILKLGGLLKDQGIASRLELLRVVRFFCAAILCRPAHAGDLFYLGIEKCQPDICRVAPSLAI